MRGRLVTLLPSLLFVIAACSSDRTVDLNPTPAPLPTAAPGATGLPAGDAAISVVSPKTGDTIDASRGFKVDVEVDGFELVDKMGEEAKAGEGHVVFYVWNGFGPRDYQVPTALGEAANAGGTGYVAAASAATSYEWIASFLSAGEQDVVVQLVNNDHTPLDPPKTARVSVTLSVPETTEQPVPTDGGGDPSDE